jgi:Rad3-related DNA helicase
MKDKDAQTKYDKRELSYASNCVAQIDDLLASIATDWENWVYQVDENNEYPTWVSLKPLKVADYAEELLFKLGHQRIMMSGTILDYEIFGRELGLKPEETTYIKVGYSPFPEHHRPIYTHIKGGKLSRKERGLESYKKCADAIATIAAKYPEKKGLILPFTDDIENGIVEALKDNHPLVYARLRQHSKIPKERDAVFREFEDEQNNEILISTYANQGFDGKMVDFTIIAKVPFGPLGDIQVKTKAENDPKWYQMMTAVELAQMAGRCVRSNDDEGHTYIIDPSFMFHFERGMKNNPLARVLPTYIATSIINNR